MAKLSVFVSYSHKDESWKDRLVTQLGVLQSQGMLELWDDRRIGPGEAWLEEIQYAVNRASAAVLLISANFLTSQFILNTEVPLLLRRRSEEGLPIYPIVVTPCDWEAVSWLAEMQLRPKDGRPLSRGRSHQISADLAALSKEIRLSLEITAAGPRLSEVEREVIEEMYEQIDYNELIVAPISEFIGWANKNKSNPVTMIFMDIDNFTGINRRFGRDVGDIVITSIERLIRSISSQEDLIIRAKDEIIVCLRKTNLELGMKVAQKIKRSINRYNWSGIGKDIFVTSSFGVAEASEDENAIMWMSRAAIGSNRSKQRGGNKIYSGPMALPVDYNYDVNRLIS